MAADSDSADQVDWTPWIYLSVEWGAQAGEARPVLLSVTFGEHHLKVLGGRFWFGLSGGELALTPSTGAFLPDHFWPANPLDPEVAVKRTVRIDQREKHKRALGAKATWSTAASAEGSASSDREAERGNTVEETFEVIYWRVVAQGSPAHPWWKFAAANGEPCLKGRLTRQEIARLAAADRAAAVQARFSVFKKDIRPLGAEGLWPHNISSAKRAVLLALLRKLVVGRLGAVACDVALAPPAPEAASG